MNSADTLLKFKTEKNSYINISNKEMNDRWNKITRLYPVEKVKQLQGSVKIEYSLAAQGAEKLWKYMDDKFKAKEALIDKL